LKILWFQATKIEGFRRCNSNIQSMLQYPRSTKHDFLIAWSLILIVEDTKPFEVRVRTFHRRVTTQQSTAWKRNNEKVCFTEQSMIPGNEDQMQSERKGRRFTEAWGRASITERSVANNVDSPDSQIKSTHGKPPPFPSQ